MSFFKKYPEFVDYDNRKSRPNTPTTFENLLSKHECFLPEHLIRKKSVLDLGCCIGATGHWVLSNGASSYCGIEIQKNYVEIANTLLSKYWSDNRFEIINKNIHEYLKECDKQFDIVVALGVIYAVSDISRFIQSVTSIAKYAVIIDSMYPVFDYQGLKVLEVIEEQKINSANSEDGSQGYSGIGFRPTPEALDFLFSKNNFKNTEGFLKPSAQSHDNDAYNDLIISGNKKPLRPSRFAVRYHRENTNIPESSLLEDVLVNEQFRQMSPLSRPSVLKSNSWEFNEEVASRFYREALDHIPDYIKVVDLCVKTAIEELDQNSYILDVGSALGFTVDKFLNAGFKNVFGVEKSLDMVKYSFHLDRVYLSEKMPLFKKWNLVTANWTLHFIKDRENYIREIFNNLDDNGILILTEKTDSDENTKQQYIEFKKERGLSLEEINNKSKSLDGVLVTKPLEWYLNILDSIGFREIKLINSRLMFQTIMCKK